MLISSPLRNKVQSINSDINRILHNVRQTILKRERESGGGGERGVERSLKYQNITTVVRDTATENQNVPWFLGIPRNRRSVVEMSACVYQP